MRFGIRELFLLAVLMALPLSSYWLVFRPQNAEIAQAKREIEHKQMMLDKLRLATARQEDLLRENENIGQSIKAIEARLPTNKEVDTVVRQVSELAVGTGLQPPAVESEKPVAAAQYMEQPLTMQLAGNFNGFYDFLIRLEQLPRITRIPDMKITRAPDTNGNMKAEFVLSIYFQQESGEP